MNHQVYFFSDLLGQEIHEKLFVKICLAASLPQCLREDLNVKKITCRILEWNWSEMASIFSAKLAKKGHQKDTNSDVCVTSHARSSWVWAIRWITFQSRTESGVITTCVSFCSASVARTACIQFVYISSHSQIVTCLA